MTHLEKFLKQYGSEEEFERLIENALQNDVITEIDAYIARKKYKEEYENVLKLDKNIITIQELRKRKEKKERDEIIKKLLEHAGKLNW